MIVSHKQKAVCSRYVRSIYLYHQSHTYAPIFPSAPFSPSPFHLVGAEISRARGGAVWTVVHLSVHAKVISVGVVHAQVRGGADCNVFRVSSP
jgi:hypothetical protein